LLKTTKAKVKKKEKGKKERTGKKEKGKKEKAMEKTKIKTHTKPNAMDDDKDKTILIFPDASVFAQIIGGIQCLLDDFVMNIETGGLSILSFDSAHIALISMFLTKDKFLLYECPPVTTNNNPNHAISLGIKTEVFLKILKCARHGESLELSFTGSKPSAVHVNFGKVNVQDGVVNGGSLGLIDVSSDRPNIPSDLNYNCMVQTGSKDFKNLCKDLNKFSDTLKINGFMSHGDSQAMIKFQVKDTMCSFERVLVHQQLDNHTNIVSDDDDDDDNDRRSKKRKNMGQEEEEEDDSKEDVVHKNKIKGQKQQSRSICTQIEVKKNTELFFSFKYLNQFNKCAFLSPNVQLSFAEDIPLQMEYQIIHEDNHYGRLLFFLASIQSSDEE
jgi:DNA polymerase III sliding clamp (beta) subunit (PCNA family)